MKYTIEGFSQEKALGFKKEVEKRGKKTILKLDHTDLLLLRWFVDFFPRMSKLYIERKEFAWVNYATLINDLPLLSLEKKAVYRRFKKMSEFGILEHHHVKDNGSFSYYGFGENYSMLIETEGTYQKIEGGRNQITEGRTSKTEGGRTSKTEGVGLQSPNKDSSIKYNSSIRNNSLKERKKEKSLNEKKDKKNASFSQEATTDNGNDTGKESKKQVNSYNVIIGNFTENDELREVIYEYIKMRKMIKSPMTDRALKLALKKVKELDGTVAGQIKILEQSIMNSWKGIFPLKDQTNKGVMNNEKTKRYNTPSGKDGSEYAEWD